MKKFLLAPAVAVALSGFVAVPALAATTVGDFTSSTASSLQSSSTSGQPAPVPTSDPNILVSPEVTPEDLADSNVGVTVLISNAEPGTVASEGTSGMEDTIDGSGTASWTIYSTSTMAAGVDVPVQVTYTPAGGEETVVDAAFSIVEAYAADEGDDTEPTPTEDPEPTATPDPTETPDPTPSDGDEDEAAVEYALSVDPKEITPADFVDQDKGVLLTVDGLEADETVEFAVSPEGSNVSPLTENVDADEDGVASWTVHGTDASDPSAYLGSYDVTVTNEAGEDLSDSFLVTNTPGEDGNAGGDDDKKNEDDKGDNGDGGSDLPRTGAELGGLAAGAALLTVGAATVLLTRRRAAKA
ncbi:hypothetical protein [Brevibacterium yomogidense]|uniref:hypothetical protein n=1 Tax=Brevibacterium yomogidense TaxID=946573 RepID=UPI0018DFB4C3|nr:hypothetical protein [Brevibacterium yomogidense]